MILDLSRDIDRQKAKERFNKLLENKKVIELTEKTKGTVQQNRYLHLILTWFGMETGYTLEEVKRNYFKLEVNKEMFLREKTGTLGTVKSLRSTADLTKEEKTLAITRFRNWSAGADIYLPSADEQGFLQEIEVRASQHKHV